MEDIFSRRPRTKRLPFGFVADPEDSKYMIPVEEKIEALKEALVLLDQGTSLTESTNYLNHKMQEQDFPDTLTMMGLKRIYAKAFPGKEFPAQIKHRASQAKRPKKTREERVLERKAKKLAVERRKAAAAQKRLQKMEGEVSDHKEEISDNSPIVEVNYTEFDRSSLDELQEEDYVAFRPNPGPQEEFLAATEFQVLYGGAAGGEPKSWFSASFRGNASK